MSIAAPVHPAAAHVSLRDQIACLIGLSPDRVMHSRCRPWSSARFSGTRHEYLFACDAPIDGRATHRLKAHEFALEGEIVADASMMVESSGYYVEALTVEAR